jgi:hypothetical protein
MPNLCQAEDSRLTLGQKRMLKKDQQIMCPAPATTSSPATFAQGEGLGVAPLGVSILLGVISRLGPNGSINITISAQSAKETCTQTKYIKRCTGMYTYRHLQVIIYLQSCFSAHQNCLFGELICSQQTLQPKHLHQLTATVARNVGDGSGACTSADTGMNQNI